MRRTSTIQTYNWKAGGSLAKVRLIYHGIISLLSKAKCTCAPPCLQHTSLRLRVPRCALANPANHHQVFGIGSLRGDFLSRRRLQKKIRTCNLQEQTGIHGLTAPMPDNWANLDSMRWLYVKAQSKALAQSWLPTLTVGLDVIRGPDQLPKSHQPEKECIYGQQVHNDLAEGSKCHHQVEVVDPALPELTL